MISYILKHAAVMQKVLVLPQVTTCHYLWQVSSTLFELFLFCVQPFTHRDKPSPSVSLMKKTEIHKG